MRTRPRSRRPTVGSRCSAIPIASPPAKRWPRRRSSKRSPKRTKCCAIPSSAPRTIATARRGRAGALSRARRGGGEDRVPAGAGRRCKGDGRVGVEREWETNAPAGVADHHYLTMRGHGVPGARNGPAGDLIAVLDIAEDPRFERQGDDLVYDLPISFTQAALGAEVEVPTPYGDSALEIQPGTQTGTVYRLRGKGLPRVGEAGRGDLHVRVHVWTPLKLTPEQRAVLEQLAKIESAPPSEGHAGQKFWEQPRQAFG